MKSHISLGIGFTVAGKGNSLLIIRLSSASDSQCYRTGWAVPNRDGLTDVFGSPYDVEEEGSGADREAGSEARFRVRKESGMCGIQVTPGCSITDR